MILYLTQLKNWLLTASASQQICASELVPCTRTMVTRSEAQICAASLSKTIFSITFGINLGYP